MMLAIILALIFGHAAMYAIQASFFSELFSTRIRYSGASLGYQLASILAGGISPVVATGLLRQTGSSWPIALFVIIMAVVSTVSVYWASETVHHDI
jgi:MFS transporter, MHS family, shikimate and dehydroshikimate transport protein